ncbi:MAG: hypothetical protein NTW08_05680 [Gammaproteobacteria bacterium]|nr:hypothetical protein [Gammaproteobacteria bacterium]
MLFTLLLVFILSGTAVIFADEIVDAINWCFAIPFVKLWLPLLIASWLILNFAPWVLRGLGYIWVGYVSILAPFVDYTPLFAFKVGCCQVVLLTFFSLLPTLFAWATAKPFRPFSPPYWGSIYMCVGLSALIALLEG